MIVVAVNSPICAIKQILDLLRQTPCGISCKASSEEELSLRCRLDPDVFVPIGQCATVYPARASRKHFLVGMRGHNFPKKVDILSMLALSWSSVYTNLFVVPVGSVAVRSVGSHHKARSLPVPLFQALCLSQRSNLNAKNG